MPIPNVVGQSCPDAQTALANAGYTADVRDYQDLDAPGSCTAGDTVVWQSHLDAEQPPDRTVVVVSGPGDGSGSVSRKEIIGTLQGQIGVQPPDPETSFRRGLAIGLVAGAAVGVAVGYALAGLG